VLAAGAPHKGTALASLRRSLAAQSAIYVGADAADPDAFTDETDSTLLSIRIGRSKSSNAAYYLAEQSDIDQLLKALLAARAPA